MEIPLAWQDPVPLTHFSTTDGDVGDIPPSPTPDPVTPPAPGAGTFFQRGFLDCAHEALRFLTEEEGMSENNPIVLGLQQHLAKATPSFALPRSVCVSSSQSRRGRFMPYTVPSHRYSFSDHGRRDVDKLNTISLSSRGSLHHKCSTNFAPSSEKMEHVFTSDLISTDDLQGVLRCLESPQSHGPQTQNAHSLFSQSLSSSMCHMPTSVELCASDAGEKNNWLRKSLDDSGISEVSSVTELGDEVDGVETLCTSVSESDCCVDDAISTDLVFVKAADSTDDSPVFHSDMNVDGRNCRSEAQAAANKPASEHLPLSINPSSPHNSQHSPILSMSLSQSISSPTASPIIADTLDSNPSSQLALLSSLSSGTHRLTSASIESGDPTASRIQSLASQILLLLQEEADAQDYSEEENDDDPTSDIGESDVEVEVEEDLLDLEAEP